MAREFIMPGRILTGEGALAEAKKHIAGMGKKAMIVTDRVMRDLGNCAKVEDLLKECGISYHIYDGITGEPNNLMIEEGLRQYRAEGCDFLIALGGGSPIDSMKAVGCLEWCGGYRGLSGQGHRRGDAPHGGHPHHSRHRFRGHPVYHHHRHSDGH